MKLFPLLFAACASFASAAPAPAPVAFDWFEYSGRDAAAIAPVPHGQFRNPILAGFYPDPSICRVGDDYYLINSTFSYYPGIPVFHSRDLVNWTQIGHAIDRPTQLNFDGLGVTRGLFAPAISHHNGTFYIVCTLIDGGGNFLITAQNPAGPWSDPVWLNFDGIDPSLCFTDDGRAWMVNNGNPPDNKPLYQGHRAIWIQEFDLKARKLVGPRSIIVNGGADISTKPVWIEGPHLYQRGEWYYLCCAEGGTSVQHSQVILRSRQPTGPYEPWSGNPILTQRDLDGSVPGAVTCTGHADLVEGPGGDWWAVFLACRPLPGGSWTTGRETFLLPVTWTADGWPRILPAGARVPALVSSPGKAVLRPSTLSGNFTWRDDFATTKLAQEWLMLRQPTETWWQFNPAKGHLNLVPREATLSGKKNPAFLARRVQHESFTASTQLAVPAQGKGSAGLAAFQSETQHFYFATRSTETETQIFLERVHGGIVEIAAQATLPRATALRLRLVAEGTKLSFDYATPEGAWQTLAGQVDYAPLTVQAAGGGMHFTGAVVGIHTRLEQ